MMATQATFRRLPLPSKTGELAEIPTGRDTEIMIKSCFPKIFKSYSFPRSDHLELVAAETLSALLAYF